MSDFETGHTLCFERVIGVELSSSDGDVVAAAANPNRSNAMAGSISEPSISPSVIKCDYCCIVRTTSSIL